MSPSFSNESDHCKAASALQQFHSKVMKFGTLTFAVVLSHLLTRVAIVHSSKSRVPGKNTDRLDTFFPFLVSEIKTSPAGAEHLSLHRNSLVFLDSMSVNAICWSVRQRRCGASH
jgi:hypothetical protein